MGKAKDMESNWPKAKTSIKSNFQIPRIVINEEVSEPQQEDWIDWKAVAQHLKNFNYKLLKQNYENNREFLITNLLFHSFRFFPQFESAGVDVKEFEERRKIELNEKLQDINQQVVLSDAFVSCLNKYVGFRSNKILESLTSIKYCVVIENIDAKGIEGFFNIKQMNNRISDLFDDKSMVVCVNHGTKNNLGYCNIISTMDLKGRSYSVQTLQSTNDDETEILIDSETKARNIKLNDCFKQFTSESLQDSDKNLDQLNGEWILSPRIFLYEYISKSLNATLTSMDNSPTIFTQKSGVVFGSKLVNGAFKTLESYTPVIDVPYGLHDELKTWEKRKSKVIEATQTGHTYQWPTPEDKEFASNLSFNLSPFPRKQRKHLEWKIEMTELFNRLFKSLSRNQIRVYLFAISIYKNYENELKPLSDIHFKHILFQLVEESPAGPIWFDENLGQTVFRIFGILKSHLQKRYFPHYFMPKWNLFADLSSSAINSIYSKVNQILEDYLFTVIHTLSKLEYASKDILFPKINLSNIESIIKTKEEKDKTFYHKLSKSKNRSNQQFGSILKEVLDHYLIMAVTAHKMNDIGLSLSYVYTIDNLIRLVEEYDLEIHLPEIYNIKNKLRLVNVKYASVSPYNYWYHNLSDKNNLLD